MQLFEKGIVMIYNIFPPGTYTREAKTNFMKNALLPVLALLIVSLSSCSVVGGIFKAGAYTGIIAVIVVLVLIVVIFSMFRKK